MYQLFKAIHVFAVILFLGNIITGLFWKFHADGTRNQSIIAHTLRGLIRADRWFTIPSVFAITATGVLAAMKAGLPLLRTGWIFWSIVVPGIVPILATLAIWTFLATWNDFMWPLIVLSDDRRYTLPVALANLVGEHVQDTELVMAGSVLTVLPVLVVFLVLQRYYIQGILAGSVK